MRGAIASTATDSGGENELSGKRLDAFYDPAPKDIRVCNVRFRASTMFARTDDATFRPPHYRELSLFRTIDGDSNSRLAKPASSRVRTAAPILLFLQQNGTKIRAASVSSRRAVGMESEAWNPNNTAVKNHRELVAKGSVLWGSGADAACQSWQQN